MKPDWQKTVLYITALGMEGCWLFGGLALANQGVSGRLLSVTVVMAIFPLAFILNVYLRRLKWPRILPWCLSWLAWAAALLLTIKFQLWGSTAWTDTAWLLAVPRAFADIFYAFRPELLALLATAILWWLARRLTRVNPVFNTLFAEFQFGLILIVVIFFVAYQFDTTSINPIPLALAFFTFGLTGISLAHAREGNSWLSGLHRGHWSWLLAASIGVILILGLLVSAITTPGLLQTIGDALRWVWDAFWSLVEKIMSLIAGLFPPSGTEQLPPSEPVPPAIPSEEDFNLTLPDWLRSSLHLGWAILMAALFIFAVWRISSDVVRWLRRKLAGAAGAQFESMPGAFRADLLGLLKRLLHKLAGIRFPFRRRKRGDNVPPGTAPVRQVYRQLLRWAAAAGCPRDVWQTPLEYCGRLGERLPEAVADLDLVTQMYVRARYGARFATPDELDGLNRAWRRLKQARLRKTDTGRIDDKEVIE